MPKKPLQIKAISAAETGSVAMAIGTVGGVWWPPAVDDVISRRHAHPDDSKALAVRIAGEVSVKVLRYALVACSIGHTVPMVMQAIGLPCP